MILIDAVHINSGGGKVLLDYLITQLEKTEKSVCYLLDLRVQNNIPVIKNENIVHYISGTFLGRYHYYYKCKESFSTIFCFGNLPPYKRTNATVYTYFHQQLYIAVPEDFSFFQKVLFKIKTSILKRIKSHTDYWIVQSINIKEEFIKKYSLQKDKVLTLPFYPPLDNNIDGIKRKDNSYIYVSNATPNKNHIRLIDAFCKFYDKYQRGTLTLTVSDKFAITKTLIDRKISKGYPIENVGFVNRRDLECLYKRTKYMIYPSLAESFGLGIVEAIENGCKVIGADLPYMHAVCSPSIVFDPYDINSIQQAFEDSLTNTKDSISFVNNEIDNLINLL